MEIGATVKLMVKVSFCMRMVMFLKAILNKTKLMGMVFTHIKMDRDTRVTGQKTCNKEREWKYCKMGLLILVILEEERNLVMVFISGLMARAMKVNGQTIRLKAKEPTNGQTAANTSASGNATNFTAQAITPGLMDVATKANTSKIKNKATECIFGQTERSTKVRGAMENSTVRENSLVLREKVVSVNGRMEIANVGSHLVQMLIWTLCPRDLDYFQL